MAPAPSPKRMHWLRSSQSTTRERASAPITSAFFSFVLGLLRYMPAVTVPKRNPLQAAVRSKAMVCVEQPILAAMAVASPNMSSGLDVAQMTTSMSSAEIPAISKASEAALTPRSRSDSPRVRTLRWAIPVRVRIHSSSVSTMVSRSLLVTTVWGEAWPTPMGRQGRVPDWAMDSWLLDSIPLLVCLCCGAKAKDEDDNPAANNRNAFVVTDDTFMMDMD
mmetsp:Transcript_14089/g.29775  ORF Transcript_14089/g.29775 Transcript_14089/m.29775 type:complete len:220 (-) Transcript_14089:605-1264(-)